MSDLTTLAREARSATTVVEPAPLASLHHRADVRRRRRRTTTTSLVVAIVATLTGAAVIAGRHPSAGVFGTTGMDAAGSSTASTSAPSGAPVVEPPTTLVAPNVIAGPALGAGTVPRPTITPAAPAAGATPTTAPAPPVAGLDPHGLSTDGLKPLVWGASVDEVAAVTGQTAVPYLPGVCEPTSRLHIDDLFPGTVLSFPDDGTKGLQYVLVLQPGLTTLSGVTVGTPIDTLRAKVPAVTIRHTGLYDYWFLWAPDHHSSMAFGSADGGHTVTSMLAGVGDVDAMFRECD
jgi:hypothetical protein